MPRPEVYATMADPAKLPGWIRDLRYVVPGMGPAEEWVMHGPLGSLRWQVERTIARAPSSLAWCLTGPGGTGFMRMDLAEAEDGTRVDVRRFLGFHGDRMGRALQQWWGHPRQRLEADLAHLVEVLRGDPTHPTVNAVGFRPTASGF